MSQQKEVSILTLFLNSPAISNSKGKLRSTTFRSPATLAFLWEVATSKRATSARGSKKPPAETS